MLPTYPENHHARNQYWIDYRIRRCQWSQLLVLVTIFASDHHCKQVEIYRTAHVHKILSPTTVGMSMMRQVATMYGRFDGGSKRERIHGWRLGRGNVKRECRWGPCLLAVSNGGPSLRAQKCHWLGLEQAIINLTASADPYSQKTSGIVSPLSAWKPTLLLSMIKRNLSPEYLNPDADEEHWHV
jgi:hypothetical protein